MKLLGQLKKLFRVKRKKPPKPSQQSALPGKLPDVAGDSPGLWAELETDTEDERARRGSRIPFDDLPAQKTDTSGIAIGGTRYSDHPSNERIGDTGGGDIDSVEETPVARTTHGNTLFEDGTTQVDVADEVTETIASLKAVLQAIPAMCTDHEGAVAAENSIKCLLFNISVLEEGSNEHPRNVAEQRRWDELIREFGRIERQVQSMVETPEPYSDEISEPLEDLRETIFDYQTTRQKEIEDRRQEEISPADATTLNRFRRAQEVEHQYGSRQGCLKGTRVTILDQIELWTRDFDKPPVYWLNGLAGTGKSTIAQTVAERVFADGQLGASFFCSRDFEDRSNLRFVFPTLAVQLARRYTEFRSIFVPLVQSDPDIARESLYNQMAKLIMGPLQEAAISTVIVIDALDECKDNEPASAILSILGQFVSKIPKVKFFITGRPERRIRAGFSLPLLAGVTNVFVLHDVESSLVDKDIRQFFKHNFIEISQRRSGLYGWPTREQLDLLCERAAGLFVYAVATINFVDYKNNDPSRQLDRLLQSPESSKREGKTKFRRNTTLDSLYASILLDAFGNDDPEEDPKVRSVLGALALAVNPLPPSAIATLLGFGTTEVLVRLSSIHSLLFLHEDSDRPVRTFHKSFPDFITDPARCINQRFHVYPPDHHSELLVGCLELMNRRLERNMCRLPDAVVNSEVNDLQERTDRYIDHALRYACKSWHKHLAGTAPSHAIKTTLHQFLEKKFLFWLEVLSVLGAAREAVDALQATAKWLDLSPTLELVGDYFRFVVTFIELISASAPHIYHSALPLSPQTSIVRGIYEPYAGPLARVVKGLPTSWEPITSAPGHYSSVWASVWSPCGKFIAVAWLDSTTIEVLDGATLERLSSFESQSRRIELLCFSPNSRLLTAFSDQFGLLSWDVQTGSRVGTIFLEPFQRLSHFLSSTHTTDGEVVAVAYEHIHDGFTLSISTCNLVSGTHIYSHDIPDGHIVRPIWTHGERLRFATVIPNYITIWETNFTSMDTLANIESLSTPQDAHLSNKLVLLPTLSRLAYVLGSTILVWDARSSQILLNFPGVHHSSAGTFSSDGRFFACEIDDMEVYLWKESPTGYTLHHRFSPSMRAFTEPSFSPDGDSVILRNHLTIHLSPTAGSTLSPSPAPTRPAHPAEFILEFSADRATAVVTRLGEHIATVLDLNSGDPRLVVDVGVEILALRLTGSIIAVVGEGKVATWSLPAGDHTSDVRANTNDSIGITMIDRLPVPSFASTSLRHVSISPDLKYIALATDSGNSDSLGIYDVSTGECLARTELEGYMPWFTPDGQEVWCLPYGMEPRGWTITKDTRSNVVGLDSLGPAAQPSGGFPWQSPHGYEVTSNEWVRSPSGKPLLWLLRRWRSGELQRTWGGRFLGLLDDELSEAVILEFYE